MIQRMITSIIFITLMISIIFFLKYVLISQNNSGHTVTQCKRESFRTVKILNNTQKGYILHRVYSFS